MNNDEVNLHLSPPEDPPRSKSKRLSLYAGIIIITLVVITGVSYVSLQGYSVQKQTGSEVHRVPHPQSTPAVNNPFTQVQKIGDGKITTEGPRKGYVYSCTNNFRKGGASHTGDWVDGEYWDPTKKIYVQGDMDWPSATVFFSIQGSSRVISSNDLPDHNTGVFPIKRSDPAYQIDPNPNAIAAQEVLYRLPVVPTMAASPYCTTRGPIGVMINGVFLYNALDDAGNDAVAHEVQDKCHGHPQSQNAYHYHSYSPCFESMSAYEVIGYALDGYGITGPKKSDGTYYTTDDLDECHGTTSTIMWDGKEVSMYHYVMTADYPYSIGCFKGAPIRPTATR